MADTQRIITRGGAATKVLTLGEPVELEQRASVRLPREERARLLATSVQISQTRFADPEQRRAAHAVVARIDGFADALAGSALTFGATRIETALAVAGWAALAPAAIDGLTGVNGFSEDGWA